MKKQEKNMTHQEHLSNPVGEYKTLGKEDRKTQQETIPTLPADVLKEKKTDRRKQTKNPPSPQRQTTQRGSREAQTHKKKKKKNI